MRFCAIVLLICLFTTTRSAPAQEKSPFVFSWPRETALLTTGVAAQTLGRYRVNHMRPAGPEDLRRSDIPYWERWAAGTYNPAADLASDILAVGVGGSAIFVGAWDAGWNKTPWRPVLEDLLILGEALAWSSALNLNVRAMRLRPRPFVYGTEAPAAERAEPQAAGGFYSGHASEAFLGAVYLATVYPLRHPEFEHRGWLWAGSLTAATAAATVRVASGKHFPSDVLAGAVMGSLIGLGFVQLHRPDGLGLWGTELWPTLGDGAAPGITAVRRF
jgi:membrane-associated phospholipid phosphatase